MLQIICQFTQLHVVSAHFLYILSLITVTVLCYTINTCFYHSAYILYALCFLYLTFAVFCYKIKAFHCFEYKNVAIHTNI